jgi:uncharacterized protein
MDDGLDGAAPAASGSRGKASPVSSDVTVTVSDAPERGRFEAHDADGALAGYLEYTRAGQVAVYPHTLVFPAYEGRGVGGQLVREALDDARRRGLAVRPDCPFVAAWMARNPQYRDLESRA